MDFISYPYEWCFEQWKQAALLTLEVTKVAIEYGLILKDATPFNIQFSSCKPVLIDTLSFEKYDEKKPWKAYRQFCEMFLAPLALMSKTDTSFGKLMLVHPTGIPLRTAAKLLPWKARLNGGLLMHIYMQSLVSAKGVSNKKFESSFSRNKLVALIESLEKTVRNLERQNKKTTWNTYYSETVTSKEYLLEKEKVLRELLATAQISTVVDVGGNDGHFSKIAADYCKRVILTDNDEPSIGKFFSEESKKPTAIDAIVADIANPTPSIGALLKERESLLSRLKADAVLALGLIHHLAITHQFSFTMAAELFAGIGKILIIEFPLPEDEKVQLISTDAKDLYKKYSIDLFRSAFEERFSIKEEVTLQTAKRVIYLLQRKDQ